MQPTQKAFLPLMIFFFVVTAAVFACASLLAKHNINGQVILGGNLFFLAMAVLSMVMVIRSMKHKNPNVFIRAVMSGMLLKMLLTVIAVIVYFYASGESFNKKGIFISLFLYLAYLAIEVRSLMKLNKSSHA